MLGAILLTIPSALLACTPLPPGQERHVNLMVSGLRTLPVQFAFSSPQTNWAVKYPNFAADSATALQNIRKYVKRALVQALKQEAQKHGLQALVTEIGNQIKPTIHYTPLLCNEATEMAALFRPPTNGFYCIASQTTVMNVQFAPNSPQEIPMHFQTIIVDLAISNAYIAGFTRDQWQLLLLQMEQRIRTGINGMSLQTATLTLL